MATETLLAPLWRDRPAPLAKGTPSFPVDRVLPSGRQVITALLRRAGLTRTDRIALPEWSSACVITAAGLSATPVPMAEVVRGGFAVDAVLLYEQWGWPIAAEVVAAIVARLRPRLLILDRVDVPFEGAPAPIAAAGTHVGEVWSLMKTLGLSGGGLGRYDGIWLEYEEDAEQRRLFDQLAPFEDQPSVRHMLRTMLPVTPPAVREVLATADFLTTVANESARRRENLRTLHGIAGETWPAWMADAVRAGAAPSLAPVLSDRGTKDRERAMRRFADLGVTTTGYHFDFAANPLAPDYRGCLAVPLHGDIDTDVYAAALSDVPR